MNKLLTALLFAALPALAIAVGCGSGSSGTMGAGSSSTAGSGGSDPDSGLDGGVEGGVEGGVSLASFSYQNQGMTIASVKVGAAFTKPLPPSPSPCMVTAVEACAAQHCDFTPVDAGADAPFDGGSPEAVLHAGTITVTGGGVPVMLTWDPANHVYPSFIDNKAPLWAGGETLTIAASGDGVPAFKDTVIAPAQVTVVDPVIVDPTMPLLVDRSKDLVVAWTGGGAGDVVFSLVTSTITSVDFLHCTFAASAGNGTVRAAALGLLPAGSATYSIEPIVRKAVAAVPGVNIEASTAGRLPSNELFYGPATLN